MTREESKEYVIRHCNPDYPDGKTEWERALNMAIKALEQPEIIRCKDCRFFDQSEGYDWCESWLGGTDSNQFCSYAERREE